MSSSKIPPKRTQVVRNHKTEISLSAIFMKGQLQPQIIVSPASSNRPDAGNVWDVAPEGLISGEPCDALLDGDVAILIVRYAMAGPRWLAVRVPTSAASDLLIELTNFWVLAELNVDVCKDGAHVVFRSRAFDDDDEFRLVR